MLTITKAFGKQPAGSVLSNPKNVTNYLRRELAALPLVGDMQLNLTSEAILGAVKAVGDNENELLDTLAQAARGNASSEEREEVEEHEEDNSEDKLVNIAIAAKSSSDLAFALEVADKLKTTTAFGGVVTATWKAEKVTDDAPLDTRESLLALFGAEGMANLPTVDSYTKDAAGKKAGSVTIVSDNERPHYFMVTEERGGKAIQVKTNWYHVTCDESPLGKPLCDEIDRYEAASGGKGKADADPTLVEEYKTHADEFEAHKNWLRKQRKTLRKLFTDAVALQQQFHRFKELSNSVWVSVTKTKGPTPIMIGAKVKDVNTGELRPAIGTAVGIRQFLAYDVAKAIKNGGTHLDLLKTVARKAKEPAKTTEPSIKVETTNSFFNVLSAMRRYTEGKFFTAEMSKALGVDKDGANKTNIRFFGDVYLAMAQCWPSIAGRYEEDKEAERAATEKEKQEKLAREAEVNAEVNKQLAAKLAAKHNETVIVKKAS